MSCLDQLIAEHCPDGVEYKQLGEVFETRNGYTPSKNNPAFWANGTVPWFRMEDIRKNGRILNNAQQHVTTDAVRGKPFPANSIIVATTATIGEHALITTESLANQRFTYLILKSAYQNLFHIKFLYYYCFKLKGHCERSLNQGNFASVDMKKFVQFQIPLPPLPVQEEIVRILDLFTYLTQELTNELTARRKQYEYYRDNLLSFKDNKFCPDGVEYKQLGKIASYARERISIDEINEHNYVGVENLLPNKRGKTISSYVPCKGTVIRFSLGDILIGNINPHLRKIWLANCDGGTNGDVLTIHIHNQQQLSPQFLYHVLSSEQFFIYYSQHGKGGALRRGDKHSVLKYPIPLPPLPVQEEIVRILDRFDTLCNNLTKGLPAEIEARQKQYEYYRDKLLSFPEKV